MSWDIMLTKMNSCSINESNNSEQSDATFDLPEVVSILKGKFAEIDHVDDCWLHYEGDLFAISFNLFDKQEIMLHIHILDQPEDAVIATISELCELLGCRAFDTTTGEYLKI